MATAVGRAFQGVAARPAALKALQEAGFTALRPLAPRFLTACFAGRLSGLDQDLFIKLLQADDKNVRKNFLREIDILHHLSGQPGYPVLRAASRQPPFLFHACDWLNGTRFDQLFDRIDDLALVHHYGQSLAAWLDALHARGYAHRDLSPDHIFIDDAGAITVTDFGMAKPLAGMEADKREAALRYDRQTVGMILWEMICGRPVFSYCSPQLAQEVPAQIAIIRSLTLPPSLAAMLLDHLAPASEAASIASPA